jgi:hypothetical protein
LSKALGVGGVCLFSMQSGTGEEEVYVVLEASKRIERERSDAVIQHELVAFPKAHVCYLASFPRHPMGKMLRPAIRAQVLQREAGRSEGWQQIDGGYSWRYVPIRARREHSVRKAVAIELHSPFLWQQDFAK